MVGKTELGHPLTERLLDVLLGGSASIAEIAMGVVIESCHDELPLSFLSAEDFPPDAQLKFWGDPNLLKIFSQPFFIFPHILSV
jgi:hypothetical protein